MPRLPRQTQTLKECGARLSDLRHALELTQEEAADVGGVSKSAWGNYEIGIRLVDPQVLMRVCRKFGVTTDFVYLGNVNGLPADIRAKLLRRAFANSPQ